MNESPKVSHRVGSPLFAPFVVSLALGVSLIVFDFPYLKSALILIMVGYAVKSIHDRSHRGGLQRELADSFYYLGFAFTLFSLVLSLDVVNLEGGKGFDATMLLKKFGAGLLTTIVGVVGRIVIRLLETSPIENIDSANEKIVGMVEGFLDNFGTLNKKLLDATKKVEDDFESGAVAITKSHGAFKGEIDRLAEELSKAHVDVEPLRQSFSEINQSAKQTSSAVKKKLEQFHTSYDALIQRLESMAKESETATGSISGNLQNMAQALRTTIVAMSESNRLIMDTASSMGGDKMQSLNTSISNVSIRLGELGEALKGVREIQNSINVLSQSLNGIQSNLDKTSMQIGQPGDLKEMQPAVQQVLNNVNGLSAAIKEITEALSIKVDHL